MGAGGVFVGVNLESAMAEAQIDWNNVGALVRSYEIQEIEGARFPAVGLALARSAGRLPELLKASELLGSGSAVPEPCFRSASGN